MGGLVAFPSGKPIRRPPVVSSATRQWVDQHLPLIDAALSLLETDEAEFRRRCEQIVEAEGRPMLDLLTKQLERLQCNVADVVEALAMTAARIRSTMSG